MWNHSSVRMLQPLSSLAILLPKVSPNGAPVMVISQRTMRSVDSATLIVHSDHVDDQILSFAQRPRIGDRWTRVDDGIVVRGGGPGQDRLATSVGIIGEPQNQRAAFGPIDPTPAETSSTSAAELPRPADNEHPGQSWAC